MKMRPALVPFGLCLALLASPLFGAAKAALEKESFAKPDLKVDLSDLSEGVRPGLVTSYADVIEPVQKAVVSVYSKKIIRSQAPVHPLLRQFFGDAPDQNSKQEGLGSGVILSPDGFIVTNNHVVEGADELEVQMANGQKHPARIVGTDPKTDVAVIKIDATKLPTVTLADSDKLRVGDVVFAVGNPLGVGQTVTMGIISAIGRNHLNLLDGASGTGYENFIQTDAAINMGNSGGALADAKGRLIGINTAIISPTRGNIGIGFAIPMNLVSSIMLNLIENKGVVRRGMLGVSGDTLDSELAETFGLPKDQKGVVVKELTPEDGPAAKAGMRREDLIIEIDGSPVLSLEDLRVVISQRSPGSTVKVRFLRGGVEKVVEVKLGLFEGEKVDSNLLPGLSVAPLSAELRKQFEIDRNVAGLVVVDVESSSNLRERFVPGVVILEINRRPVTSLKQARELLIRGRNLFYVHYRGVPRYITVFVP